MCRLLVFAIDQDNRRQEKRDDVWKRGDVIAVHEDGQGFGRGFDNNPATRIIEMPGVSKAKYNYLMSGETETFDDPLTKEQITITVRKRLFQIDIDGIEAKEAKPAGEKLTTIVEADLAPVEKQPLPSKSDAITLGGQP